MFDRRSVPLLLPVPRQGFGALFTVRPNKPGFGSLPGDLSLNDAAPHLGLKADA